MSEEMLFGEFARLIHVKPSYVTKLKKAGRLVLTKDGRRVKVDESLARIEATRDPAQRSRLEQTVTQAMSERGIDPADPEGEIGTDYQAARAARERYNALMAKRDYELSMRQLLKASDVEQAVRHAATELRRGLEKLPDVLAPRLAATSNESQVRAMLADEVEHVLDELSRAFAAWGAQE